MFLSSFQNILPQYDQSSCNEYTCSFHDHCVPAFLYIHPYTFYTIHFSLMYLILSTLPHFCSIFPLIKYYKQYTYGYIHTILLSVVFSILYHAYSESNYMITFFDYGFAGTWFVYDIYMGYRYTTNQILFKILLVNGVSCCTNMQTSHDDSYIVYHSIWHIINSYKSFYVSTQISLSLKRIHI
jgi:hypothetical protein